jgi:hypothetical protein
MSIADPGDPNGRRQLFRRDLVLHFHRVPAAHIHLRKNSRQNGNEERQNKNSVSVS